MATASPPIPLQYFPSAARPWKPHIRRLVIIAALASATLAWHRWRAPVWLQIQELYYQHQCLNYAPPPGLITYDEDSSGHSKLLGAGGGYVPLSAHAPAPPAAVAPDPQYLAKFLSITPSLWPCSSYAPATGPILFAHKLHASSGATYLVIFRPKWIDTGDLSYFWFYPFESGFDIECQIFRPATWTSPAVELEDDAYCHWTNFEPMDYQHYPHPQLRFYAGQINQNDPSRFTIPYDINGKRDYLDGYLDDRYSGPTYAGKFCLHLKSRFAGSVTQPSNDDN